MSEPDVSNLLTVAQAIEIIDSVAVSPAIVRVPLAEAQGLFLAEDLVADRDYPPFDKSLMDGYAVRSADVSGSPTELLLVGEIAAGKEWGGMLGSGETVAIMTGASMPGGADGVVPIEETARENDTIRILSADNPGRFIARRGADIRKGEIVLKRGVCLQAAQLAVAATIGAHHVDVHPRVRVAVLATGDELVQVDEFPGGSQIRNSNTPMLVALLRRLGCDVADLGIAADKPEVIRAAIEEGLLHDVLFITGGMSMGAYDYVPRLLKELNLDLKITKLRIKPGKPFVFATGCRLAGISTGEPDEDGRRTKIDFQNQYVFGLPGNPVSGFACAVRFASRLLARLAGGVPDGRCLVARLSVAIPANGPREFYQPAKLSWSAQGLMVAPLPWKGSADLFTLAGADALLVRPENDSAQPIGALVQILEI